MTVLSETLMSVSVAAMVTAVVSKKDNEQQYILVVGLGITGVSVVRYLKDKNQEVVVIDNRKQPPGLDTLRNEYPDVSVYLGEFDEALFMGASQIIVSPGVSLIEQVIQRSISQGVEVIGDIELFAREVKAPVIAITGSNGKKHGHNAGH